MKEYWLNLQPRERKILLVAGGVLFVLFLYLGIWEPMQTSVIKLKAAVVEKKATLNWMKIAAVEVKRLQGTSRQVGQRQTGESLLSLVDRTAKQAKLADSMKRVQPDGESRVRVWLERASFDSMTLWLETLQRQYEVVIVSSQIEGLDIPGEVDVRLVLQGVSG